MHTVINFNRVLETVFVGLVLFAPNDSRAQQRGRAILEDSSAARILERVGRQPESSQLRDIVRQVNKPVLRTKLDEIGDSLARRAIEGRPPQMDSISFRRGSDAIIALSIVGRATGRGTPYGGALVRLIRIYDESAVQGIRRRAVQNVLAVGDHASGLAFLERVAESRDSAAVDAVQAIELDGNGRSWVGVPPSANDSRASREAMSRLKARGRVVDNDAAASLRRWFAAQPT